jgi:Uma2 family endonuclease
MPEAPKSYRITVEQYHRMGETGIIPEGARVELVDGEIVEMSAMGSRHAASVRRLNLAFSPLWDRAVLSGHCPVALGEFGEPLPDFALVRARDDKYSAAHPAAEDIHLLVEVSDSSLAYDRGRKSRFYARHGVPEYWIVDLAAETVEIRRKPEGDEWGGVRVARRGERIALLAFPEFAVMVEDLLP